MVLRRIADMMLLWLAMIAAILACFVVANLWPSARPRADATKPLPKLPMEVRGPSVKEVVEQLNRRWPEWASPPDVVDPDP
jgi:hypothetical protein